MHRTQRQHGPSHDHPFRSDYLQFLQVKFRLLLPFATTLSKSTKTFEYVYDRQFCYGKL